MSAIRWIVVASVLAASASCVEPGLVDCGDGTLCPSAKACAPTGGACVDPEQVDACRGLAEGAACTISGVGDGVCRDQVCIVAGCGDAIVDMAEACDDGNTVGGDGCSADCSKIEMCGDGVVDEGEPCDDGNTNTADGCDACTQTEWVATPLVRATTSATALGLANPRGIAIDGAGRIYFADTRSHRIRRVDGALITTIAGTGAGTFGGDGGPATSAGLNSPTAVAVDGVGRVFIADAGNHRIRRIDELGTITTIAGTGTPAAAGENVPAITAPLNDPQGLALDGQGRIYIADTGNHKTRLVETNGMMTTFAGTGTAGTDPDGVATMVRLNRPASVAVGANQVCIADTNSGCVRCVDAGGMITTRAGLCGQPGFTGDGTATAQALDAPEAVAIDAQGNLVIADTANHRIRRVDAATQMMSTIAGSGAGYAGDGGPAAGALVSSPEAVAFDATGQLLVADTANHRIRRIDVNANITTIAGDGSFRVVGDGGAATSAQLFPWGLAVDGAGRLLVADRGPTAGQGNDRIRQISAAGTISTIAGSGVSGRAGDGGQATSAQLSNPEAVAIDSTGRVYIADASNGLIRRIELDGTVSTFAGGGSDSSEGVPATQASLSAPRGIAIDAMDRVYIAEYGTNRVRRVAGGLITTFAGSGTDAGDSVSPATSARLNRPRALAIDGTNLYIADASNFRVVRVDTDGTTLTKVAGGGIDTSDGIDATLARLGAPEGLAVDGQGGLYIADRGEHRIRKVVAGTITTVAGTRAAFGDRGDGGLAVDALLSSPQHVVVDGSGRLVISDTGNRRVRRIEANGVITTIAGAGDPDGMGPVEQSRLADPRALAIAGATTLVAGGASGIVQALRANPALLEVVGGRYEQATATGDLFRYRTPSFGSVGGVAYDGAGQRLFVAETSGHRLHAVTIGDLADESTWQVATLANEAGTQGFQDGAAATARFSSPAGVFFAAPRLLVADRGNHVIRSIDVMTGMVSTIAGQGQVLGFQGDGGDATGALLHAPEALTRCPNGDLFIADTANHRVRRIDGTGTITTVLGDGSPSSSGTGSPSSNFPVNRPLGIACDAAGNVYVSSTNAIRLLLADGGGVVDGTGSLQTIYGPSTATTCLTGIAVLDATTLRGLDACSGQLVELVRRPVLEAN